MDLFSFLIGGEGKTEVMVVLGVTAVENKKREREEGEQESGRMEGRERMREKERDFFFQHLKLSHD